MRGRRSKDTAFVRFLDRFVQGPIHDARARLLHGFGRGGHLLPGRRDDKNDERRGRRVFEVLRGLHDLRGHRTSSALQFLVCRGRSEVFLSILGRVYRSEVVSEFGPKT